MQITAGAIVLLSALIGEATADTFNYRYTKGDDYGPADWKKVSCDNLDTCPGWPDKHESSIGWELEDNQCRWCPDTGNKCPFSHRMSPVNLVRDRAIEDHPNWKDCPDWHWMNFEDGSCKWDDMEDSFEISKHALQIHTPMRSNGDINCANSEGERRYPRLDYSKGFPDWWHLDRTDIKVPSEHTQHGKRYAAEVSLAHFYEIDHWKNQVGYVTMFMQDYPGEKPWYYLDKLICKWRREEEKQRKKCNLPPAPVYKMCELYRGQQRTPEDFEFPDEALDPDERPISELSQIVRPPAVPLQDFGANPDAKRFPLQLCEGDCDFTEDCAPGLICHRRDPFEDVPGCLGGEQLGGNSDFCMFDPFGPGYNVATKSPTASPTVTASPTLNPLPPKPTVDFGGTPPAELFPLQRCQGDCDSDSDCADGLICFQRNSNQAIPGCIGGESNPLMIDFCVLDPNGDGYTDIDTSSPTTARTDTPTLKPTSPASITKRTSAPTTPAASEETNSPTKSPTNIPTAKPTQNVQIPLVPRPTGPAKSLLNRGWEPNFLLGECEGDCDNDGDCMPGLICFSRETARVGVPGCVGGEEDTTLTDYCTYPPLAPIEDSTAIIRKISPIPTNAPTVPPTTKSPTGSPTGSPTESPTKFPTKPPTSSPTKDNNPKPLVSLSWSPPRFKKLGRCEGDCDIDEDCKPGLRCFQRFVPNTPVPGCIGGEENTSLMDFCVYDTRADTAEPVPAPAPVPDTSSTVDVPAPDTSSPVDVPAPDTSSPVDVPAPDTSSTVDVPVPDNSSTVDVPAPDTSSTVDVSAPDTSSTVDVPDLVTLPDTSTAIVRDAVPQDVECSLFSAINFNRFCDNDHHDKCCQSPRSSSNYCHESYDIIGEDNIASACHHCCEIARNQPNVVGGRNEEKPGLELFTNRQCADEVDNTARICKDQGCCDPEHADTKYCREQIREHGDDWERICWYCCYPSKEFTPVDTRRLLSTVDDVSGKTEEEMRLWHKENPRALSLKDVKFNHTHNQRTFIVREENFGGKGLKDEDAYFDEIHGAFQQRKLQEPAKENYEDVHWWPYEWLLKVGTEYYYRYEGSMTVPPCYSVNHWRVMKDPIRVAKHQITELERLIAWRINGRCQASTAGKERENNPDAVNVNRPLQELQKGHRMVFCECQDWPSKFPQERAWCDKWQKRDPELRLFENPYNWAQNGF